jgi:hypothetical protein
MLVHCNSLGSTLGVCRGKAETKIVRSSPISMKAWSLVLLMLTALEPGKEASSAANRSSVETEKIRTQTELQDNADVNKEGKA